jgi:hypothetical protein
MNESWVYEGKEKNTVYKNAKNAIFLDVFVCPIHSTGFHRVAIY